MDGFIRDVRHAVRALARTPVLFATAVLTLAVGTGLATGVLAVAYGVLLRPLPYAHPDRLVAVTIHQQGAEDRMVGLALDEFDQWVSRFRAFERLGGHSTAELTVRGAGEARSVRAAMVTDGFFETLAMSAYEGSTEAIARGQAAAALSMRLSEQLGAEGSWRDRGLTIGASSFQFGAVMPAAFTFPVDDIQLWVRADEVPGIRLFGFQDQRRFQIVGRLAAGVTIEQAREDVRRVARELEAAKPPGRQRDGTVRPLHERSRREARATVVPFLAGAALVLLIACANVSGLLVGRAVSREREFAVRRALGGSMRQILRASLAESVTIALGGWALGLWLARLIVMAFESLAAGSLPNLHGVRLDAPVVLVSLALALLVALLSGGAPALRAAATPPGAAVKSAAERIGGGGTGIRGALVVGQIALTVVLLVTAGLLMRTVEHLMTADLGFDTANALAMRLRLTQNVRFEVSERAPLVNRLLTEVRALPGVVAAGIGSDLPPNGTQVQMTVRMVRDNRDETFVLSPGAVTPGYLEGLGVTVLEGRLFEERDRVASTPPVVISATAARLVFADENPVGREWPAALPGPPGQRVQPLIIGVVGDIKHRGLDQAAPAVIYVPWERLAPSNAHIVVRTTGDPERVGPALRRIVRQLDPALPLFTPETMEEVVAGSIADRRLRQQLAAAFGALAVALAMVALWGAMAQNVFNRRRELAVRLALGSTNGGAVRLMLRGALRLIASGIAVGAVAGIISGRTLQHLLHGVSPADPATFATGAALALVFSVIACYVPARRAAAVSPAELLRDN